MSLGRVVKQLMKERGIKQSELAEAIDVSPASLSNHLLDKREWSFVLLSEVAKYLNIDLNYFANASNALKDSQRYEEKDDR